MYRRQAVLALLALCLGLAHSFSWDVVLGGRKQLQFYSDNLKRTHIEDIPSSYDDITSVAYDPVHGRVLFAGANYISSFDIASRRIQTISNNNVNNHLNRIIYSYGKGIQIAYDPVTQLIFWIDGVNRSIHSMVSQPGCNSNTAGRNILINFDAAADEKPNYITVDSCAGYIYWTIKSKIEKARFDGSEREVVIDENGVELLGIAIDQQTQKMYWVARTRSYDYSIESADLNGENRRTFQREHVSDSSLTVTNDFIYWGVGFALLQLTKNQPRDKDVKPKIFSSPFTPFRLEDIVSLASNYKINEQSCKALKSLQTINSVPGDYDSTLCIHGTKVSGESRCECTPGYIGGRCEIAVCHNYCFQGDCSVSAAGLPKCRCNAGYSGDRCQVNACLDYCLNNGVCSLNEEDEPVCQCTGHYGGDRCDVPVFRDKCLLSVSMLREVLKTDETPLSLKEKKERVKST